LSAGGLEVRNAACRVNTAAARYEFACAPQTPWSETETERLAARLDAELAAGSAGYRAARAADRLAAPTAVRLDADAFVREWHLRVAAGVRPAQAKDRLFRSDDESWRRLTGAPSGKDHHARV
jgi:hypothetical protein